MSDDLGPCPFCGSTSVRQTHEGYLGRVPGDPTGRVYYIECLGCGARGGGARAPEDAVRKWHMRPDGGGDAASTVDPASARVDAAPDGCQHPMDAVPYDAVLTAGDRSADEDGQNSGVIWCGYLTPGSGEEIAARLRDLLDGKMYARALAIGPRYKPEVWNGLRLQSRKDAGETIVLAEGNGGTILRVSDTFGRWEIGDPATKRSGESGGDTHGLPFIRFYNDGAGIIWRAQNGEWARLCLAVQSAEADPQTPARVPVGVRLRKEFRRRMQEWESRDRVPDNWTGTITIRNSRQVASRLRAVLGGKPYTRVMVEGPAFDMRLLTGCRLNLGEDESALAVSAGDDHATIVVRDSRGEWGATTSIPGDSRVWHGDSFMDVPPLIAFGLERVTIVERPQDGGLETTRYVVVRLEPD